MDGASGKNWLFFKFVESLATGPNLSLYNLCFYSLCFSSSVFFYLRKLFRFLQFERYFVNQEKTNDLKHLVVAHLEKI